MPRVGRGSAMAGTIYCFSTLASGSVYKAGHTQTELATRLRGYLGPSKPRVMVFARAVSDSVRAEKLMLSLMRQCVSLRSRDDLGNERFEATGQTSVEERHAHLTTIADVVALALPQSPRTPAASPAGDSAGQAAGEAAGDSAGDSATAGLGTYFKAFDRFVAEADLDGLTTATTLMRAYEESEWCPVISVFLPHSPKMRAIAVGHRYRHVLSS